MHRRHLLALAAALPAPGRAQGFPDRPVRLVVPFAPGGIIDVAARILAEAMAPRLAGSIVIENTPGGGSTIGVRAVTRATPDGHTLLLTGASQSAIPALFPDAGFDVLRDFAPVALLSEQPFALAVHPEVPARDLPTLVAWLRQRPGEAHFATTGLGAASHLAGELLKQMAGVDFTVVPYRGTPQAVTDLVAGRAQLMIDTTTLLAPLGRDGQVRLLGVTTARRSHQLPALPTLQEQGLAGFTASSWQALYAPAGTPAPVLHRLEAAALDALGDARLQHRFEEVGLERLGGDSAALGAYLRAEIARWTPILRAAGVRPG